MEITAGETVDGIFRITRPFFKKGGSGVIHLALNLKGEPVALKFLVQADPEKVEEFKREYFTLLQFSHPNVARVQGFGIHAGQFYIAYEYADGVEFRLATTGQPPAVVLSLFLQGLQGLKAIHTAGFLHLDIKSSNILVTREGTVKIIDFGMAQLRGKLDPGRICGSVPYLAPEMVLNGAVGPASDLFSFGVLMHSSLCAGFYPFPKRLNAGQDMEKLKKIVTEESAPDKPSRHNIYCPGYLDDIVLKMLACKQENRFSSAEAVIQALKTHGEQEDAETPQAKGSYLRPKGDAHIGREEMQQRLGEEIARLGRGETPQKPVFWISGESGMGKSHLLKKIKAWAEQEVEKISIHHLELPPEWPVAPGGSQPWLEGWLKFLEERLAENEKPVLILVDNVEFLPDGNPLRNFLTNLLEILENRGRAEDTMDGAMPVFLCMAATPFSSFGAKLTLAPFTREEVRRYLSETPAFQGKEIPDIWVERLYKQTAGNPGELAEFLQKQESKGLLFGLDGKILIAQAEDISIETKRNSDPLPSSTRKRLDSLLKNRSAAELETLRWLSVWQKDGILEGARREEMEAPLQSLTAAGLLEFDTKKRDYRFPCFSYLAEFVYQGLAREEREKRHSAIARGLQGRPSDFHRALGPFSKESVQAALAFGKQALWQEADPALAGNVLKTVFQKIPETRARLKIFMGARLLEANYYAQNYPEAESLFAEIGKMTGMDGAISKGLKTLTALAYLPTLIEQDFFDEAQKLIQEHLDLFGGKNHFMALALQNCKAWILYKKFHSEAGGTSALLEEARKIYEETERLEEGLPPHQKNWVRNNEAGIVLQALGLHDLAARKLKEKLDRLENNPNRFIEFATLLRLAEVYRRKKDHEKAMKVAEKAYAIAQQSHSGKWIQHAHQILACLYQDIGICLLFKRDPKAKEYFERALKENRCCFAAAACLDKPEERKANQLTTLLRKGQCHQELGNWNLALEHFHAVLDFRPAGLFSAMALLGVAECQIEKGNIAEAEGRLGKISGLLKSLPEYFANAVAFKVQLAFARCFAKKDQREKARECLKKTKAFVRKDGELLQEYRYFESEMGFQRKELT